MIKSGKLSYARMGFAILLMLVILPSTFSPLAQAPSAQEPPPWNLTLLEEDPPSVLDSGTRVPDSLPLSSATNYWAIETVDSGGDSGQYTSLAIDSADRLHVSYYDVFNTALRYATNNGSTWITTTVDNNGSVGQHTSLDLDNSDLPHISYYESEAGLRHAYWNGASWVTETVDYSADVGEHSSLGIDVYDNIHISYYDAINTALKYAVYDGAWVSETLNSYTASPQYTSLDAALYPHIAYYNVYSNQLQYVEATSSGWDFSKSSVNQASEGGEFVSLALDSNSDPHISYFRSSSTQLIYAHHNGTSWSNHVVDTVGYWYVHTSIAVDENDLPHIAYYDDLHGALIYAFLDQGDWVTQTIDSGSDSMWGFPSIALDSGGYPHITYYDNGSLQHAWLQPCIAPELLDISGPSTVFVGSTPTFTAAVLPPTTTLPITFTWEYSEWEGNYERVVTSVQDVFTFPTPVYVTGTHFLTVTAENCGGAAMASHEVIIEEPPRPDLFLTDLWEQDGEIHYQLFNGGQATAISGHALSLSVDGLSVDLAFVYQDLLPGDSLDGSFAYSWDCTDLGDTISAHADSLGMIYEEDETNNTREEVWACDTIVPQFTWGPTTTLVLTDSVVIQWGTSENSDSRVYYDTDASGYSSSEYYEIDVTAHQITLTGLDPSTVYRYMVESTDPSGNTAASDNYFFETDDLPSNPLTGTMTIARSSGRYPSYEVSVIVDTSSTRAPAPGVDHVSFYMNDVLVGEARTPTVVAENEATYQFTLSPNRLGLSRNAFFVDLGDAYHEMSARLFSPAGTGTSLLQLFGPPREEIPVDVELWAPLNNWVYTTDESGELPPGTTIQISAEAMQYEWECEWVSFRGSNPYARSPNCGDVAHQVDMVKFVVNGVEVGTSNSPTADFVHTFDYDAGGLETGTHTFQAVAIATDGSEHPSSVHTILVEEGTPSLDVQRTVTRNGNFFEVELTISLAADAAGPARLDYLIDWADELMPVQKSTATYDVSFEYPAWLGTGERLAEITIDFRSGEFEWIHLAPGNSLVVTYNLVPILYEDGQSDPHTGIYDLRASYWYEGEYVETRYDLFWQSLPSVQHAFNASDYVLVTNPSRLHDLYAEDEVHDLLGTMAHLATIRNGVLGFLDTYVGTYANGSDDMLRNLTDSGGYWAEALNPAFQDTLEGYMLIVGETEVVPAWDSHDYDICWSIPDDSLHCEVRDNDVFHHDQWYSNTSGNGRPELIVGRIIGDSAWQLERPLIVSIGVVEGDFHYYAPGNALLVSGRGSSVGDFKHNVDVVDHVLDNPYDPIEDRWVADVLNLPDDNTDIALQNGLADYVSLLHLMGHGNYDSWGGGGSVPSALVTWDPPDLYGYTPFVFAPSCLTGNYEADDDYNLAESLFDQGISAYIGATQVSPIAVNSEVSIAFYVKWNWESEEPLGRAFAQTERAYYDEWSYYDWYRFWIVEYNFYGDPKFGASGSAPVARAVQTATAAPTTTLHVQVPAYVVTTTFDGFDQVEIPGGKMFLEGGLHEIPYWTASVDYAPGYRVQDVDLTLRTGQTFTTSLNLPTAVMTYYTDVPASTGYTETLNLTEDDGWFPALDEIYDWHVSQNPDGSSVLEIQVFPFHYQPATTHAEWHDYFTFAIEVISTSVEIDGFDLDAGIYTPDDSVAGDLWFSLTGDAQDLILAATVRDLVTGEVVDGLPLDALHDVAGPNHYGVEWNSTGFDPGQYLFQVDLLDSEGQLLDSASEMFRLGAPSAEITAFSATPNLFQPGDPINTSLTIHNTGPVAINGEAIIQVQTTGGVTVTETFTHTVTSLAPEGTVVLNDVWDTTATMEEEYRIIGYVKYDARTTEVETVFVSIRAYIYLPLVLRSSP